MERGAGCGSPARPDLWEPRGAIPGATRPEIRAFGLGAAGDRLLVLLALFKVRSLLDGRLRLRTACDLEVDGDIVIVRPTGFVLPTLAALRGELPVAIRACAERFASPTGVTTVEYVA